VPDGEISIDDPRAEDVRELLRREVAGSVGRCSNTSLVSRAIGAFDG